MVRHPASATQMLEQKQKSYLGASLLGHFAQLASAIALLAKHVLIEQLVDERHAELILVDGLAIAVGRIDHFILRDAIEGK